LRKKLIIAGIAVIILAVIGGFFFLSGSANAEVGNLQVFNGSAEIIRGSKHDSGATGTPVELRDRIRVDQGGKVAIILKDNTIIRLEGGSEVEVAELTYQGGKIKDAVFRLTKGRAWSRVQKLQSGSNFEVETPTVTAAVRGTSFNTTFKNQVTGIYVYHHNVSVTLTQAGGRQDVPSGQLLQMGQNTLVQDFAKGPNTPPDSFFDEWIRFNQAQDDMLCQQRHDIPEDCDESSPTNSQNPKLNNQNNNTTPTNNSPYPNTPNNPTNTTTTPPPVTLNQVVVSCAFTNYNYPNSNPDPCTAKAKYSDGKIVDVTAVAQWSDSPAVGGFQLNGAHMDYYAQYVSSQEDPNHNVTVKATYGGKTGSIIINTTGLG